MTLTGEWRPFDGVAIATLIDISAVQAWHTRHDVAELAQAARTHGFVCAHVLPAWVPVLRPLLDGSSTLVGAPVGFPSGGASTAVKRAELDELVAGGVDELDVVLNVGWLRSGLTDDVAAEVISLVRAAAPIPVKVILEVGYLADEEIKAGASIALDAGAAFVKTGTGWSGRATTIDQVRLIAEATSGAIGIKASGGIRDLATMRAMWDAGATRFGINLASAISIVEGADRRA